MPGHIPGAYARLLDEYLAARRVTVLAPVPQDLERLPMLEWRRRLVCAAECLGDPQLGLHLGQSIRPAHFGVLGYLFHACGNLAAALARLERYQRLVYDFNPLRVKTQARSVELAWSTDYGRPGPLVDECAITALVTLARQLVAGAGEPLAVQFINPAPDPAVLPEYAAVFGCAVGFDAAETVVAFPLEWLGRPLCRPDASLLEVLEREAERLLAALPHRGALSSRVVSLLARRLPHGPPTQVELAAELAMSARSLHRALLAEGQSYRKLLMRTRQQLAERYLRQRHISLAEVAQLCGYTEQSAFSRAYRQWTGHSPREDRRAGV